MNKIIVSQVNMMA